jgi:mycoredoxin
MADNQIVIYATDWCSDCRRAREFLDKHGITYQLVNIDYDKAAEKFVIQTNRGNRSVPTIVFPGGDILVEPSNRALAEKIGIPE